MPRVRWGILSTSGFALQKVLPAWRGCRHVELAAIASRDLARARAVAADFGIARAHGSYDALLADPEVDAVYNPLPNHLHVPWTIKALEAGKHVLCEKPIAMTAAEAETLLAAARRHPRLKVMEAFMYRLHPQWQRTVEIVRGGGIGELRVVQSLFSYFNDDPGNIRNQADAGGGALMDIGCYAISLARLVFGAEPRRVLGLIDRDPRFATDRLTAGVLDFGGRSSSFTVSTQLQPYQRVHVLGTEGRIEIEIPFNAPPDRACWIWHQRGERIDEIAFEICDQYTIEGDAFSQAILDDTPVPAPLDDAVANMRVIDAVFASARTGAWVELG
ncbi:MAG TPA: Gfo/Idh/MocA family oxidoreductase [Kofleriaceae bacterium]|jgi:predicted dehydrogenase|nr:Gfo/Idh/MocA family oxidoreductase [Kofleriaceae bacterium]